MLTGNKINARNFMVSESLGEGFLFKEVKCIHTQAIHSTHTHTYMG